MVADARELVDALLTWEVSARLGARGVQQMKVGEVHEVLRHTFFAGVDWEALEAKKVPPPFEWVSMDAAVGRTILATESSVESH